MQLKEMKLVEHCRANSEVMSLNPVEAWKNFFRVKFVNA